MKKHNLIQVFEYGQLNLQEEGFEQRHWDALGWYNEQHGGRFFHLTPGGVKFHQYVGVIQVGTLTIEILPKIGRETEEKEKATWQSVLIDMLRECQWMHVHAHEKASLQFKPHSILEAYLELYVRECERIVKRGLVKKYRLVSSHAKAWKGRMLFHKQIQKNLVHRERFFTRHQVYDPENLYNQILYKALKLIPVLSQSPYLKDRVYSLLLSFPDLEDVFVNEAVFRNMVFDRKTEGYKEAMEMAAMLLLNYRPDIMTGQNHVLAILFDMNDLWEEYVFRQLYKHKKPGWSIRAQNTRTFWRTDKSSRSKSIRPDIVVTGKERTVILDTKWKIPDNNIPEDGDLKQMFVYNEYWGSDNVFLLYPQAGVTGKPAYYEGSFVNTATDGRLHGCGVLKVSVLDPSRRLDPEIGKRIHTFLEEKL